MYNIRIFITLKRKESTGKKQTFRQILFGTLFSLLQCHTILQGLKILLQRVFEEVCMWKELEEIQNISS